jgi:VanZ family protein
MSIDSLRSYARWTFAICLVVVLVSALMPPQVIAPIGWDKMNHVVAFAVLAMLGCSAYLERRVRVLLGLLAYGVLIEWLQSLTDYRMAEALDVLADGVGILVGWTFTHLLWRARLATQMPKDLP